MQPMQDQEKPLMNKVEIKKEENQPSLAMKLLAAVGGVLCGGSFLQLGALLVLVAILFEVTQAKKSKEMLPKEVGSAEAKQKVAPR